MEDMCYERRRAEACVDESARHALANAGGREIVGKKEGEQKGSARGSVHWGCYYATAWCVCLLLQDLLQSGPVWMSPLVTHLLIFKVTEPSCHGFCA